MIVLLVVLWLSLCAALALYITGWKLSFAQQMRVGFRIMLALYLLGATALVLISATA